MKFQVFGLVKQACPERVADIIFDKYIFCFQNKNADLFNFVFSVACLII